MLRHSKVCGCASGRLGGLEEGELGAVPQLARQLHVGAAAHLDAVQQADARRGAVERARRLDKVPRRVRQQLARQHKGGLHAHGHNQSLATHSTSELGGSVTMQCRLPPILETSHIMH